MRKHTYLRIRRILKIAKEILVLIFILIMIARL